MCSQTVRPAETPEDQQVTAAGWRLFGAYQSGWGFRVVQGTTTYDGMCRPLGYQGFVFHQGQFAGTVSPVPMDSRTDGAAVDINVVPPSGTPSDLGGVNVEFSRYSPNDPLCCPSGTTFLSFQITRPSTTGPVLVAGTATPAGSSTTAPPAAQPTQPAPSSPPPAQPPSTFPFPVPSVSPAPSNPPQPSAAQPLRASRPPDAGCSWQPFAAPNLGLELLVQRCEGPGRGQQFFATNSAILESPAGTLASGGHPIIEVFDKPAVERPADAIRRQFISELMGEARVHCFVSPSAFVLQDPRKFGLTIAPDGYLDEKVRTASGSDVPDDPCGDYGISPDAGIRYFEFHPDESATKFIFVRVGQDAPSFDEQSIRFTS
jgi:hypothetical protein